MDDNGKIDYYNVILEFYHQSQDDQLRSYEIDVGKNHLIITLMSHLRQSREAQAIKNALLLFLSLFEDQPVDRYHNLGKTSEELSLKEREQIQSIFKEEYAR
jgi:hypothetical protein